MLKVAAAINSLASNEAAQPSEQVFVLTSSQLEAVIRSATAPLITRIEALEDRQIAHSDQNILLSKESHAEEEIRALNVKLETLQNDLKKYHVWTNSGRVEDLWDWIEDLDNKISRQQAWHIGKKTEVRIKVLKTFLKTHRAATFGEIMKHMNLSKSQFSQLVAKLDKRIFEVRWRETDPTKPCREKILILRERLREPLAIDGQFM
jgi:hypothetical protein